MAAGSGAAGAEWRNEGRRVGNVGCRPALTRRPVRGIAAVCATALALAVAACSHLEAQTRAAPTTVRPVPPSPRAPRPAAPPQVLQVMPAPYQLPWTVSREVVLPAGRDLIIVGGLNAQRVSTGTGTLLDPVTGATRLRGRATAGPAAYLAGGSGGTSYQPAVLATRDGSRFTTVARLAVAVRYAAVTAAGSQIWVFGGETPDGPTSAIQRADPSTGKAAVVGHLPQPVQGASAVALGGHIYVAGGQVAAASPARGGAGSPRPPGAGSSASPGGAGPSAGLAVSRSVLSFDPASGSVTSAGQLPVPVAYAGAAAAGGTGYLVGGSDGKRDLPAVTTLRLVDAAAAVTPPAPASAPWLASAPGPGHLAPGSDPSALPADVLIADHRNNRLLIVDPGGRVRWEFPRPGDLAPGQSFLAPDDAFFSPDGRYIIATQEDDDVITVINVATSKIAYRYGTPGVPGSGPDQLWNPDDAMLTPAGRIVVADIKNCRIVVIKPPAHSLQRVIGTTDTCLHRPPGGFGSPNGAFPLTNGNYLVTEINGDWADEVSPAGKLAWSAHPPGVAYPSDTNEVYPGRYLTVDYTDPGQVVEFGSRGRLLWRLGGFNQPSLALPLPNGDILLNDDFGHRVVVVDPATNRIAWQYGHTGVPGQGPGYLSDPDGVDLVPPDSLLVTHAATMGEP